MKVLKAKGISVYDGYGSKMTFVVGDYVEVEFKNVVYRGELMWVGEENFSIYCEGETKYTFPLGLSVEVYPCQE